MDTSIIKILYADAFNDIESARNYQISISQKKMEIQMIDINNMYSSYDNIYLNSMKKQNLEMEISNLINIRNNHINNAIYNALTIAENEFQENSTYSVATIVINSIVSFISTIENGFGLSFTNRSRLSKLLMSLSIFDTNMFQLKSALEALKRICF